MNSIRKHCTVLISLVLLSPVARAGGESGGQAGSFLNWGVGARAIAMGKTFSAIADDASALYWNPAGLQLTSGWDVSAMHALIFEDRAENYFAVAHPISKVTVGLGWLSFGVGDIQQRAGDGQLISTFSDAENAFMLGAGLPVAATAGIEFNLGMTVKYFHQSLFDNRATGWGADLGSLINFHREGFVKQLGFALVIQNLSAKMKWNTQSNHEDDIPVTLRLGSAANLNSVPICIALDVEKSEHKDVKIHTGVEYAVQKFALRAGLDHDKLTAGVGFAFQLDRLDLVIDYAYTDDDISNNGLHFFSFGGRF